MRLTRRNLLVTSAATAAAQEAPKPAPATSAKPAAAQETPKPKPAAPKLAPPGWPGSCRTFRGEALREIAFPLGGIGTGTVSLGGRGDLRDWEIFNRPNKGGILPLTFAALRLAGKGLAKPVIRVLERRPHPPFTGSSGVPRETALGLPRFRDAVFTGAYPFAHVRFQHPGFPAEVSLEAFNPMIPLETEDSGLPVAIFTYALTSRAASDLEAAIAFSLMNPAGYDGTTRLRTRRAPFFGQNLNQFRTDGELRGLFLSSQKYPPGSVRYGSMALLTTTEDVSCRLAWEHGAWWDEFQKWWDEFLTQGRFAGAPVKPSEDGATEYATLCAHVALKPGETKKITFVLAWHFPNTENYWNREKEHFGQPLRNWYGSRFPSAW
jgi:uncharacterized protein (DUF608 family)